MRVQRALILSLSPITEPMRGDDASNRHASSDGRRTRDINRGSLITTNQMMLNGSAFLSCSRCLRSLVKNIEFRN
jgi:hypothetical protein